jgi:two-component sensor histidine kinase
MNELNHRLKNTLATVQAIVAHTLKASASLDEAQSTLSARIMALSRAQDVLTKENWNGADLTEVISVTVAPHAEGEQSRFDINGPQVSLGPRAALALSLAVHELATNAAKYGALSREGGQIEIRWTVEGNQEPALLLRWRETGGPAVASPTRKGFGSHLIERGLAMELDAEIGLDYAPSGLIFTLRVALAALEERAAIDPSRASQGTGR